MPDNIQRQTKNLSKEDSNRDPITGSPGAHPIGTGVGAAAGGAGGMAAGAAMGSVGGPVGGAVGAAIGAVAGGLAGKSVAEKVNPTEQDTYWREHYTSEPYYDSGSSYDDYQGAYRTGYEGYARLGGAGRRFEEIESELQRDYARNAGPSKLTWEAARPAVRAAWQRFDRSLEDYVGYDVVDRSGNNVGTLECLWADHVGEPAFVGVRTGWFLGKTHVVPASSVEVNQNGRRLRLPYTEEKVKNAPAYDSDIEMTEEKEQEIYQYYGLKERDRTPSVTPTQTAVNRPVSSLSERRGQESPRTDEANLRLAAEQLKIGKREVEAGGVRLRKVVRTETVNQPVELRREEIVIERVPADPSTPATAENFGEEEVYIPLRREEAVLSKEVRVREEVRARKQSQTDTQNVSEAVRKEDLDIERTGEARERNT